MAALKKFKHPEKMIVIMEKADIKALDKIAMAQNVTRSDVVRDWLTACMDVPTTNNKEVTG